MGKKPVDNYDPVVIMIIILLIGLFIALSLESIATILEILHSSSSS